MAKIYKKGSAIIIEGIDINPLVINSTHFDFKKIVSDYYVRDGIENQSYNIGNITEITDLNDNLFADENALVSFLEGLVSNIDVNIQDQHTEVIDLHLCRYIQELTLEVNASMNDKTITVSSLVEPTNGHTVCLKEGEAFYQANIISHAVNGSNWDLVLDTPLDFAFTISCFGKESSDNLAYNGSVTPGEFIISPKDLNDYVSWDINGIVIKIIDDDPMDDATFGGILGLTNGIIIRTVNGITKNICNIKTNGDFREHRFSVEYSSKAPSGSYGFIATKTFNGQNGNGVAIRLDARNADEFKIIVQDDLSGLDIVKAVVQGHVVSF